MTRCIDYEKQVLRFAQDDKVCFVDESETAGPSLARLRLRCAKDDRGEWE
jgi:hypothetical protein